MIITDERIIFKVMREVGTKDSEVGLSSTVYQHRVVVAKLLIISSDFFLSIAYIIL